MIVTLNGLRSHVLDAGVPATAPIMVVMHGIGADETDLEPAYRVFQGRAVLAYLRSPLDYPPGYAWYHLIRPGMPDPLSFEQGLEVLEDWLAALLALPGLAGRPVILSGFSQGAAMALSYTLRHPEAIAGVMAFSGYVPPFVSDVLEAAPPGLPMPRAFVTLGRHDPLFPFSRLDETRRQLEARGIRPEVVAHDGGHEIPFDALKAAATWFSQEFPVP